MIGYMLIFFLFYCRSKSTTPQIERRQLPYRPNMDSSGNDSEGTDVTSGSGSGQPSVDMNQISTMTLDEFKNLLNSALSVPNGGNSEGSQESPRSQSSTDSYRNTSFGARVGMKKPPAGEKPSRYKIQSGSAVSKSLDSKMLSSERSNAGSRAPNGYFEMEKPAVKRTILASSANHRSKTPVNNARPKTPTSQRPKTPVSSTAIARPKTPVSTSRPKTPVSLARPTTPVSLSKQKPAVSVSSFQSVNKPVPKTTGIVSKPQAPLSSSVYTRLKATSSITETRTEPEQIPEKIEQQAKVEKPNVAYVCINADESVETKQRSSTIPNSQGYSENDSSLSNSGISTRMHRSYTDPGTNGHGDFGTSNESNNDISTEPSGSNDSLIQSFNALQRSIAELRNRAQQACIAGEVARKECAMSDKKPLARTFSGDSAKTSQSESVSSSLQTNKSLHTKSDIKTHESAPTSILKRSQTIGDSVSSETSETDAVGSARRVSSTNNVSSEQTRRPSTPVGRPSTPTGRPSTPSLIPRPMTPVSSLGKSKPESSIPQPAVSSSEPAKSTGIGRPPTPKKATILAKAPSAGRNVLNKSTSDNSYRSIYQNRRSTTPGPNEMRTMSLQEKETPIPRRSMTPGPGSRSSAYSNPQVSKSLSAYNKENQSFDGKDETDGDKSFIERNRARAASASPMIQRRAPGQIQKTLSRQPAIDENITVTVDRNSGRHSISVKEGEETRYKSERNPSRVLARAPTPTQRKTSDTTVADSRGRARNFESALSRPRPRSVDPENWNRGSEEEVVAVVQRNQTGGHKIHDRTEAWVESAAKTVASRPTPKTRRIPPNMRRSKTPNPNDIYEKELESRSLSEIKAALTLPVNGLKEVDTTELDAPPEDPEMYAKMEILFQKMRERELKASVNVTPGQGSMPDLDVEGIENEDESSLDSNENIKRKNSLAQKPSPASSARGSVPSTPPRSKTPSMSRSSSSSQPISRPVSTPPRPSTPTRSSFSSSRRSSTKSSNESAPPQSPASSSVDHAVVLVSKIKQILNPKPRRDDKSGPRSRIPAPKSLAASGKSRSFSNISANSENDWHVHKHNTIDHSYMNGNSNYDADNDEYDDGDEISGIISNAGNNYCIDNSRSQSGTKTPVPKLATPLTTGRKAVINREPNDKSSKLVRAVSVSSLSSSSNTMSCPIGDEEEFV